MPLSSRAVAFRIISIIFLFLVAFQLSYWRRIASASFHLSGDDEASFLERPRGLGRVAHQEGKDAEGRDGDADDWAAPTKHQSAVSSGDAEALFESAPPTALHAEKTSRGTVANGRDASPTIFKSLAELSRDERDSFSALFSNGAKHTDTHCVNRGMQTKCLFHGGFMVQRNQFHTFGSRGSAPDPIFPPDGQKGPLVQYHKYHGHRLHVLPSPSRAVEDGADDHRDSSIPCDAFVTRPTVFLYRMSGHSTYHLWENNLGPFFATLNDGFDLPSSSASVVEGQGRAATTRETLKKQLNDPHRLLVAFVDNKPANGPKAPHLLNKLLSLFSDVPLLNASAFSKRVCFLEAIVGISANHFPHRELLHRMMENVAGYSPPAPLPAFPSILFISRNHHSVVRGRKIANEEAVLQALNTTFKSAYDEAVNTLKQKQNEHVNIPPFSFRKVHMEDYSFEDQIRLSMQTHMILSPHGGGVTNCIWMREGSVTVEFVAPVGKTLTSMYHTLCGKSGVSHFHFLAEPDPADEGVDMKGNARLFSNMVVPPDRIVENAKKALRLYAQNLEKFSAARNKG